MKIEMKWNEIGVQLHKSIQLYEVRYITQDTFFRLSSGFLSTQFWSNE